MAEAPNSFEGPAAPCVLLNLDEKRRERSAASDAGAHPDPGEGEATAELPSAQGTPDSSPEPRSEQIADLKARIASGRYKPDPEEVAKEMLKRGF